MENVFTRPRLWVCINDTMVDESMPPERKAPRGTSDRIRIRTASRSIQSSCSIASCSSHSRGWETASLTTSRSDQYGWGLDAKSLAETFNRVAAGSLLVFLLIE